MRWVVVILVDGMLLAHAVLGCRLHHSHAYFEPCGSRRTGAEMDSRITHGEFAKCGCSRRHAEFRRAMVPHLNDSPLKCFCLHERHETPDSCDGDFCAFAHTESVTQVKKDPPAATWLAVDDAETSPPLALRSTAFIAEHSSLESTPRHAPRLHLALSVLVI